MKTLARLLMFACLLSARDAGAQQRPSIGLALSGGAMRGVAHIGVLEWLEEHRIPVDYIAGTSMGGVIGAFYAIGMSPPEIRHLIMTIDWERILTGPASYDELSFRRKEDRREYPATLEFGWRAGLQLPRSVNPAHHIGLIIDRLMLPYSTIDTFDELPIPFRCVATDLIAAESIVLGDGSLGQALRATMAIPGIFAPVDVGDRILADGGLLNNLPGDVVRQMGADVIIAVNVGAPLDRGNLQSLTGILGQVVGLASMEGERRVLAMANVVVAPDLSTFGQFEFEAREEMMNLGFRGADTVSAELQRYALDPVAWEQHLAARNARKRTETPAPRAIEVTGTGAARALEIAARLNSQVGHPVDSASLERELSDIRGNGRDESLSYEIVEGDGIPRLLLRVREKSYGPPFIIPAIQLQSRAAADVAFSAGFRLTHLDVGARGAELRLDAMAGSNTSVGLEYFLPFGPRGPFVAPRVYVSSDRTNLYEDGERRAQYLVKNVGAAFDAGYMFGKRAQIRAGYQSGIQSANVDIGGSDLPDVDGMLHSLSARFEYNGLNNAIAPSSGIRVSSEYSWYLRSPGASGGFPAAELSLAGYLPVSRRGVLFGRTSGGTTFTKSPGPAQQFTLGGPFRLSAYGWAEFRGRHYVLGSAGYRHQIGALPRLLGGNVYASLWAEQGSAFFQSREADYRHDAAVALLLDTVLGPLTFGGAWGDSGKGEMFFSFGPSF